MGRVRIPVEDKEAEKSSHSVPSPDSIEAFRSHLNAKLRIRVSLHRIAKDKKQILSKFNFKSCFYENKKIIKNETFCVCYW